jgi:hypothetical protein
MQLLLTARRRAGERHFQSLSMGGCLRKPSERGNDASLFGPITVHGDPKRDWRYVINIYGQLKPGKPSPGRDSAASRLEAFGRALNQIAEMPELKSIGFPYGIGCGLAGGDWNKYGRRLEDFAERVGERGAYVILYRLGQ